MVFPMWRPRVVYVRAYIRRRLGRFEHVCAHMRSSPRQRSFAF